MSQCSATRGNVYTPAPKSSPMHEHSQTANQGNQRWDKPSSEVLRDDRERRARGFRWSGLIAALPAYCCLTFQIRMKREDLAEIVKRTTWLWHEHMSIRSGAETSLGTEQVQSKRHCGGETTWPVFRTGGLACLRHVDDCTCLLLGQVPVPAGPRSVGRVVHV